MTSLFSLSSRRQRTSSSVVLFLLNLKPLRDRGGGAFLWYLWPWPPSTVLPNTPVSEIAKNCFAAPPLLNFGNSYFGKLSMCRHTQRAVGWEGTGRWIHSQNSGCRPLGGRGRGKLRGVVGGICWGPWAGLPVVLCTSAPRLSAEPDEKQLQPVFTNHCQFTAPIRQKPASHTC